MWCHKENISISLDSLAREVNGELIGDGSILISSVCSFFEPQPHAICYLKNLKKLTSENYKNYTAILVPKKSKLPDFDIPYIRVDDPVDKFIDIVHLFFEYIKPKPGISKFAAVSETAVIGNDVHIGDFCSIGEGVQIGNDVVIHPHVVIYPHVKVGNSVEIHSGVTIREFCEIEDGIQVQNGAVIGSDGFGYTPSLKYGLRSVPQLGQVRVCKGVDIGANSCVDRGTAGDTVIGQGTKLDNLVQVGHNAKIGNHVILCGQVGVSGSANIGDQVVLGGNSGVGDHVSIVPGARIGAKTFNINFTSFKIKLFGIVWIDSSNNRARENIFTIKNSRSKT